MFYKEVVHEGLNKRKVISGRDPDIVSAKARQQQVTWEEQWQRQLKVEKEREAKAADKQAKIDQVEKEREAKAADKQANIDEATQRTREAEEGIEAVESTLQLALGVSHVIVWEDLKDNSPFPTSRPVKPKPEPVKATPKPVKPKPVPAHQQPSMPLEPRRGASKYLRLQRFGVIDRFSRSRRQRKIVEAQKAYERDHAAWEQMVSTAHASLEKQRAEHAERIEAQQAEYSARLKTCEQENAEFRRKQAARNAAIDAEYAARLKTWEQENAEFQRNQAAANAAIDKVKDEYFVCSPTAVEEYCQIVLASSEYRDRFPQEFKVEYIPPSETLIVEYSLPRREDLPTLKEVKYVHTRDELSDKHLSDTAITRLYDSLLYQVALRTVHELYDADAVEALASVVFNGWVTFADKATGKQETACIMSLQTTREEFLSIDLGEADPKECFRHLKGVGSSKLHSLTPVAPVLTISREDSRFVYSYDVADELDEGYNLAAMDWEDFEHLIRELFESEFSQGGGEVKVTQASRDGGVDAVAFDPDPIRGGKTVIQAKRYTNVVGVSAVRDLWGTVMNEGAMKGILVTTADYGPDAYEFARGKPLTLLNGGNLLHLLAKHGHKAKIDLKEAKLIQAEREKEEREA